MDATTETVENYLKAIHRLAAESPAGEAGMKAIATMLGVATGTATAMVKRLARARLAKYQRFGGVRLTPRGRRAALDILRRHRLIETFLVRTLRLDWSIVHHEAERLEHAVSPVVLRALDAFLGHPAADPHGDPIPDGTGRLHAAEGVSLARRPVGSSSRVLQVADQSEAFLRFAARSGLVPGRTVTVLAIDHEANAMTVQTQGLPRVALAIATADRIRVTPAGRGGKC
jgi:DtxR family transcriptional regulator, Mn-dependent transcriptional regulator